METYKADTLVVGGSLEGCIAALESAKRGHKVLLVESSGSLGGAATNGLCVFMPQSEAATPEQAAYVEMLYGDGEYPCTQNGVLFYDQAMKVVLQRALARAGVQVLTHMYPVEALVDGGRLAGMRLAGKTGPLDVSAERVIDATDRLELAGAAGLATTPASRQVKTAVKCNRVDTEAIRRAVTVTQEGEGYLTGRLHLPHKAHKAGLWLTADELEVYHNTGTHELIVYGLTAALPEVTVFTLGRAQAALRGFAYTLRDALPARQAGFEEMNIIHVAPRLDHYGLHGCHRNPYENLWLMNNGVEAYDNLSAILRGIEAGRAL